MRAVALALGLALAACDPPTREDVVDAGSMAPDAEFDGVVTLTVNGVAYAVEDTVARYYGNGNYVLITARVRCPDCTRQAVFTAGLRADGPTDCTLGTGVEFADQDIFPNGLYASPGAEPCGLTVEAYGTDFGARVAGQFAGELALDEIGEPMTLDVLATWDVTL